MGNKTKLVLGGLTSLDGVAAVNIFRTIYITTNFVNYGLTPPNYFYLFATP